MDEKRYRESRICRLLGNPIVYQLVILLEADAEQTGQADRAPGFDSQRQAADGGCSAMRYFWQRDSVLAQA